MSSSAIARTPGCFFCSHVSVWFSPGSPGFKFLNDLCLCVCVCLRPCVGGCVSYDGLLTCLGWNPDCSIESFSMINRSGCLSVFVFHIMCSVEDVLSWILKSNQPLIYWLWTSKNHADKETIASLRLRLQKALTKPRHRHVSWINTLNARHPWERFRSSLTSGG